MTQTTINQRIKFLVDNLSPSARAFSEAINESPTNTFNYIGGRLVEPRANYLTKVILHFGNISAYWLLTGEGEAFTSAEAADAANSQSQSQNPKKNRGTITNHTNNGPATYTTLADCAKENEHLRSQVELLNRHLDEKERTIQILLNQQSRPQ